MPTVEDMAIDIGAAPRSTWRVAARSTVALRVGIEGHQTDATLMVATLSLGVVTTVLPGLPKAAFLIPIAAASWLLPARRARLVHALVLVSYLAVALSTPGASRSMWLFLPLLVATMVLAEFASGRWTPLGVVPAEGGRILADLRQRMQVQTAMPQAPAGWIIETCTTPARGGSFSGDLVVGHTEAEHLELLIADVSGVGAGAATRAAMLGSAAACLLGSTPTRDYLPRLNSHLVRQEWEDGFATAQHLSVNARTGRFSVGSAGHPAALRYCHRTGEWSMLRGSSGVALGLLDGLCSGDYQRTVGALAHGDLLVFYTDGVVESCDQDLMTGVERLIERAEQERQEGVAGMAGRLVEQLDCAECDDRTVMVVGREVPTAA